MPGEAIGRAREIFAALCHIRIFELGRNARSIGGVIIGKRDGRSACKCHRPRIE
jgi:hypothetical protein